MLHALINLLPGLPYTYEGESRPCAACGGTHARVVARLDRRLKPLRTLCCDACGLLRTDPMPTDSALARYYADEYRFDYQFTRGAPSRVHRLRRMREAADRIALLAPVLVRDARVLDVGCGSGEFLEASAVRGVVGAGIEPGRGYAAHARERAGLTVHETDLEHATLPRHGFDVVTSHHVLEHHPRPVEALARMRDLLAPGGVVHVAVPDMTPNDRPLFKRLHFAHVHGFTPQTLALAAWRAGLTRDTRFTAEGCVMVFRRARPGDAPVLPDPAHAARMTADHPPARLGAHIAGGFLRDAFARLRKHLRDTSPGNTKPEDDGRHPLREAA
ncbi:class I SAM-dependent methyltransferase [Salinarimonas sp. NSM]|uniref:class I SAM-dependent methyltransferase n=1 Tax=Salinarimonas sp. NSM TaxID=3458003 RepID=UPI0040353456